MSPKRLGEHHRVTKRGLGRGGMARREMASLFPTTLSLAKLLANSLALGQVAEQGIGEERLSRAFAGPLELVVAMRHVIDQILHPDHHVFAVRHGCAPFLRLRPDVVNLGSSASIPVVERDLKQR